MIRKIDQTEVCPYCLVRPTDSDDHIFLRALGGHRTVPSCKSCNDRFGHTFEGRAISRFLHPILVQLGGIGVPVLDPGATWRSAGRRGDGQVYDASLSSGELRTISTRPIIREDPTDPRRMDVIVGDDPVGQRHMKKILSSGKFRVTATEKVPATLPEMEVNIEWGPDLKFTALKMAFAASKIAFPHEVTNFEVPRRALSFDDADSSPICVAPDFRDHSALDAIRSSLSHVIYIEQQMNRLQAFVQFFGSIQFWVELTTQVDRSYETALVASLDPITGIEKFDEITPLGLPPFSPGLVDPIAPIKKLNASAAERGGRTNEMIKINRVQGDGKNILPTPYVVTSWTGDYMFRRKRGS